MNENKFESEETKISSEEEKNPQTEVKNEVPQEIKEVVIKPELDIDEPEVEEPEVPEPVVIEEKPVEVEEKVEPIEEEISEEVSIPEEKVEEKPEIVVPEAPRTENKTTFKVLIGIIVVLLLIILFGVYWIFFRQEKVDTNWEYTAPVKETASVVQVEEQQAVKEDTLLVSEDTMVVQPVQEEQTMVLPEDVVYEITGTITTLTLEPGQTLVKLALKYYGSKNFWPYIVQHNPDVIKDADRVPKGATIKIPKLEPKK